MLALRGLAHAAFFQRFCLWFFLHDLACFHWKLLFSDVFIIARNHTAPWGDVVYFGPSF